MSEFSLSTISAWDFTHQQMFLTNQIILNYDRHFGLDKIQTLSFASSKSDLYTYMYHQYHFSHDIRAGKLISKIYYTAIQCGL